jgi:hypothetical protein
MDSELVANSCTNQKGSFKPDDTMHLPPRLHRQPSEFIYRDPTVVCFELHSLLILTD